MTDPWLLVLIVARVALFALGAATTAISFRAFRREGTRYLRDATLAFGIITVGVVIEGVLYQFTTLSLEQVHVVESVTIGLGLVVPSPVVPPVNDARRGPDAPRSARRRFQPSGTPDRLMVGPSQPSPGSRRVSGRPRPCVAWLPGTRRRGYGD